MRWVWRTGLDLREQERRWRYIREGRPNKYHGIAIHPRHLSFFETAVLGLHKQYNPLLDDREERISALQQVGGWGDGRVMMGWESRVTIMYSGICKPETRKLAPKGVGNCSS